jgi:hypothetical protein
MENQEEKLVKLMRRVRVQYNIGTEFLSDKPQDMSTQTSEYLQSDKQIQTHIAVFGGSRVTKNFGIMTSPMNNNGE